MSFYQRPVRRWPWVLAGVLMTLAVSLPLGYLWGHDSAPSLKEQIRDVEAKTTAVYSRLAVIETEYPQAVKGGKVVGEIEYAGVKDRAGQAVVEVERLRDSLGVIDPARYRRAVAATKSLADTVEEKNDGQKVQAKLTEAQAELTP